MQFKIIFKKIIPPGIWNYLRYLKFRIFRFSKFAPHNIDFKLSKYLNYEYGYFVELGANDGFTESNTLYLEIKKNWRGVLIEPLPDQFLNCCYYRSKPGNHLFCNAAVNKNFNDKYVEMIHANLMSVANNLSSDLDDKKKHIQKGRAQLPTRKYGISFGSEAKTLTKILDEAEAPEEIDLLSLDVEGSELAVLNGLDFKKYKFKFMLIECRKKNVISNFLKKYDYTLIDRFSHHDYLFKLIKKKKS